MAREAGDALATGINVQAGRLGTITTNVHDITVGLETMRDLFERLTPAITLAQQVAPELLRQQYTVMDEVQAYATEQ